MFQKSDDCEKGQLQLFATLVDYNIYTTLNAKNHLRAPTEFGLCLRTPGVVDQSSLRCLACESERTRTCWLTAMRLAKVSKIVSNQEKSVFTHTTTYLCACMCLNTFSYIRMHKKY